LVTFLMGIPGDIRNWQGIPRMMVRRAMEGILPPAIAWRRWKALFSFLMDEGIAQDYAQAARYLRKDMLACKLGYVNKDIVEDELRRIKSLLLNPYHATSWHIRDILGLELWLQFYSRRN